MFKKIRALSLYIRHIKLVPILEMQLFLTCISLPILIGWGLPVSLVSIASTPLFAPLFTFFLIVSSAIFITELLRIPNTFFIYLLELITHWWQTILSYNSPRWLISIACPSIPILLILPATALVILHQRYYRHAWQRALLFGGALFGYCLLLMMPMRLSKDQFYYIACHDDQLIVIQHAQQLTIIDNGALGRRACNQAWLEYTLMSLIRQQTGSDSIAHLITTHGNKNTLETLQNLCTLYQIPHIYMPAYQTDEKKLLDKKDALQQAVDTYHGTVHTLAPATTQTIQLSSASRITIKGDGNLYMYNKTLYPRITVHAIVDSKQLFVTNKKTQHKRKPNE